MSDKHECNGYIVISGNHKLWTNEFYNTVHGGGMERYKYGNGPNFNFAVEVMGTKARRPLRGMKSVVGGRRRGNPTGPGTKKEWWPFMRTVISLRVRKLETGIVGMMRVAICEKEL